MSRRGGARAGRVRRLMLAFVVAVVGAVSVAVSAVAPVGADPSVSATASVTPNVQGFNDVAGGFFVFSVHNRRTAGTIGAVEISRASASQTIVDCVAAPSGWTVERTRSRCRYRSAAGTGDDIAPGQVSSAFMIIATTATGTQNTSAPWSVKVARRSSFDDLVSASAEPPGLTLALHSFDVQAAMVDPFGDSTVGAPCPSADRTPLLPGSGGHTVVVCGRNGTRSTLTPSAARSSLSGSLLASSGTFESGPIAPSSESVVLARWTGAVVTSAVSSEHTLTAQVGSDPRRFSPARPFGPYTVFNAAPAATAVEASTAEGTPVVIELVGTDPEPQPLTFSIVGSPQHGSLAPITPGGCSTVAFVGETCRATVRYTPDPGFSGDDSFSYRVNDGVDDSQPAVVSVLVYRPSAPPVNGFALRVGGPANDTATALAVDDDGNTIVAGHFEGTMDLDPGEGVRNVTAPVVTDLFLAKYSQTGELLWGTSFGAATEADSLADVAVDAAGNIAITGGTNGVIDFGGGPRPGGRFGGSAFVASFAPDGTHRWSFGLGESGPTRGLSVAFDGSGNLLAGGFLTGLVDVDPGPGQTLLGGGLTGYVVKYDPSGALVWAAPGMGGGAFGMDVGPAGEVLVTGRFRGTQDFDPGPGVTNLTSASFLEDAFIVKLDSAGALAWARRIGAFPHESADDVAVDANGDVVITGSFSGTVDLDPGPGTMERTSPSGGATFLLKLTAGGEFVWVDVVGTRAQRVALDGAGNVVMAGSFGATVDFDPGSDVTSLTARGAFDVSLASYDGATGGLLWARALGGPGADGASGLVLLPDGAIRLVGADQAGSDFDPGPDVYDRPDLGLTDVFLVELDGLGRLT